MTFGQEAGIPDGLVVELSRGRVLDGCSDEADRWMQMLRTRRQECLATLDRERMAIEIVFRLREDGNDYLYWLTVCGSEGSGIDTDCPIDRDHLAAAKRTKEPGWVEAEPQVVLLAPPVEQAVHRWALRAPQADPAADIESRSDGAD